MRRAVQDIMGRTYVCIVSVVLLITGCTEPEIDDTYVGYVEGEFVYVSAPESGWIVDMTVKEGDVIESGMILFELDADHQLLSVEEAEARVSEADARARNIETGARPEEIAELEARLEEAEAQKKWTDSEYQRMVPLLEKKLISQADADKVTSDRDQAHARVVVARKAIQVAILSGRDAELEAARASVVTSEVGVGQAEWSLTQRTITSRTNGRVEAVYQRQGEFTAAGMPVLAVLPEDGIKIRFFLPQSQINRVQTGDVVEVSINGGSSPVNATVSFVATEAEFTPPVIYSVDAREKLVFMVEARLPAKTGYRPGVPVDIIIPDNRP